MAIRPIPLAGGAKTLGGEEIFVIAEIGKNFIVTEEERPMEEYIRNAKKLIDEAARAGADAVKFQTHEVEDEQLDVPIHAPHFDGSDRYRWVMRNTLATPPEFWREIAAHARKKGVLFFSTPMSRLAARKLMDLDVPLWKVASGDVLDRLLLHELMHTKKPIVLSTGMVSKKELRETMDYLKEGQNPLCILYCISMYPCPPSHFNLATMADLQEDYPDALIGFSDHSLGHEVALAAIKTGAKIIEKHFSLSRESWGPDHKVSMTPDEMSRMIKAIRQKEWLSVDASPYHGSGKAELEGATNSFRPYFHKALMAASDLPAGAVLSRESIVALRPAKLAGGLPSHLADDVIGKTLTRAVRKHEPISSAILTDS